METAKLVEKVLFKSFLMGFILLLIATLLYTWHFEAMYKMVMHFFPISKYYLLKIFVIVTSFWKLALIQFFLFPAIALHFSIPKETE